MLERADGTPITDREVRSGLRLNIIAGALGNVWVATALGIPFVMLLQALNASGIVIGLATTVQQLAMVVQIPAALLADRFRSRKKLWAWSVIPHRLLWFLPALLPLLLPDNPDLTAQAIVLVVGVSAILAQAGTACWFSWMTDLVPPASAGRFWGKRQSLVMIVFLAATWATGYVLDIFPDPREPGGSFMGFAIVFGVGAFLGTLDVLVHLGVPEPKAQPSRHELSIWQRILEPLRGRDFRYLSLALGVWTFGVGMAGSFGVVYLRRDFDISYTQLSATTIAASIGVILAGLQSGYIIDRLGARAYSIVLLIVTPLLSAIWFCIRNEPLAFRLPWIGDFTLPQPVVLLCLINVPAGALYSSLGLCQLRLLSVVAPREGRTMAMAVHWTIIGLTGALGPLLGGAIMDWFTARPVAFTFPTGTNLSFFHVLTIVHALLAWAICIPLVRQLSVRKGDIPVGEALPRLWLGNPMRAVRHVYSIYAMSAPVSMDRRADAIRDLGEGRAAIAVSDLIEKLDDPAYDVREESVRALGRLATKEATVGLIVKLESPDCDLAPQIARALRTAKSPLAVDALQRLLASHDRETVCEAARALGFQRATAAGEPLLKLLATTAEDKIFAAAGEALARLRERRALPILQQRLRTTTNALLKKSLRLNIADLLGEPGEFYPLLTREQTATGSEAERLLGDLRDRVNDKELVRQLERAFEKSNLKLAADLLGQITGHLPVTPEAGQFIAAMRDHWESAERMDVLLGIYILHASR